MLAVIGAMPQTSYSVWSTYLTYLPKRHTAPELHANIGQPIFILGTSLGEHLSHDVTPYKPPTTVSCNIITRLYLTNSKAGL